MWSWSYIQSLSFYYMKLIDRYTTLDDSDNLEGSRLKWLKWLPNWSNYCNNGCLTCMWINFKVMSRLMCTSYIMIHAKNKIVFYVKACCYSLFSDLLECDVKCCFCTLLFRQKYTDLKNMFAAWIAGEFIQVILIVDRLVTAESIKNSLVTIWFFCSLIFFYNIMHIVKCNWWTLYKTQITKTILTGIESTHCHIIQIISKFYQSAINHYI